MVNQFHDILPGSSIGLVYEDTARDHAAVFEGAEALAREALAAVVEGEGWTPVNTIGAARAEVAEHPELGEVWVEAPGYGFGSVTPASGAVIVTDGGERIALENGILRAELDRGGRLRSLVHLASGREAMAGDGNRVQVYDDRPTEYEAWALDPFHLRTARHGP